MSGPTLANPLIPLSMRTSLLRLRGLRGAARSVSHPSGIRVTPLSRFAFGFFSLCTGGGNTPVRD